MQNATWSPGCTPAARSTLGQPVGRGVELGERLHRTGRGHDDGRLVGLRVDVGAGVHGRDGTRRYVRRMDPAPTFGPAGCASPSSSPGDPALGAGRPGGAGDRRRCCVRRPTSTGALDRARPPRRRLPGADVRRAPPPPLRRPRVPWRPRALRRPAQLVPRPRPRPPDRAPDPARHGHDRGRPAGRRAASSASACRCTSSSRCGRDTDRFADPFTGDALDGAGVRRLFEAMAEGRLRWDDRYLEPVAARAIVVAHAGQPATPATGAAATRCASRSWPGCGPDPRAAGRSERARRPPRGDLQLTAVPFAP